MELELTAGSGFSAVLPEEFDVVGESTVLLEEFDGLEASAAPVGPEVSRGTSGGVDEEQATKNIVGRIIRKSALQAIAKPLFV